MASNGKLPRAALTKVSGVFLSTPTANAFYRMAAVAKREANLTIKAYNAYSGYRSLSTQYRMRTTKMPWLYGMTKATQRGLAVVGASKHGLGTAVDIAGLSGTRLSWMLRNAHRFGFSRPMPGTDPSHFVHDGRTSIAHIETAAERAAKAKENSRKLAMRVARVLNRRKLGVPQALRAARLGKRDPVYYLRLAAAAKADKLTVTTRSGREAHYTKLY